MTVKVRKRKRAKPQSEMASRCERLGLALLAVDPQGEIIDDATQSHLGGAVHQAVIRSPQFVTHLRQVVAHWVEQTTPACVLMWPGCWALPIERVQRRRCVGYHVAIVLSRDLAKTDQFRHACDHARLDFETASRRLVRLDAVGERDAELLSTVLNWTAGDLAQAERKTQEIDKLTTHLGETYEELSLVYKLSENAMVSQEPAEYLADACAELHQVMGSRWIALQMIDSDERMREVSGRLIVAGATGAEDSRVTEIGMRLIECFSGVDSVVINDLAGSDVPELAELTKQALIVPIKVENRLVGVMIVSGKRSEVDLSSVDGKLATAAAQNMGIFLENAMLYEDSQDLFMGTLHALIASIDAKDTYTCGHSERVAWLSRALAEAAGLADETVERVYLSALVHDVGKIGVPESVLCKPGRLTDEEFDMIKAHPEIGARILKDIRQMRDLIPGVLDHHERYDGRGYPNKVGGEDISLFGRLICLADSFDAMSSNRTYRSALTHEKVLAEIRDCAGTQFDPALAEVFLKIDFTGFFEMLQEHQNRKSPLDQAMRNTS